MAQCAHTYVRDMAFAYSLTKRAPSGRSVAPRLIGLSINGADVNHVVGELAQYRHTAGVSIRGQASVVWDASWACVIVAMNSFIQQGSWGDVDFFKHVGARTMCDKHVTGPRFSTHASCGVTRSSSPDFFVRSTASQSIVQSALSSFSESVWRHHFRFQDSSCPTCRQQRGRFVCRERIVNVQGVTLHPFLENLHDWRH